MKNKIIKPNYGGEINKNIIININEKIEKENNLCGY
jgi:hypothetical protein